MGPVLTTPSPQFRSGRITNAYLFYLRRAHELRYMNPAGLPPRVLKTMRQRIGVEIGSRYNAEAISPRTWNALCSRALAAVSPETLFIRKVERVYLRLRSMVF